jgi:hypothetical protein
MARAGVLPAVVTVAVLAGSCTSTPPPVRPKPSTVPLVGTIVAVGGAPMSIVRYALPAETATTIDSPIGDEAANRGTFQGIPGPDGAAEFITVDAGKARVFELPAEVPGPTGIGDPLPVGPSSQPSLSIEDGKVAVATCSGVWTTPVRRSARWDRVGTGCWAVVGPAGELAFSPTGDSVVSLPVGGRRPRTLFRLDDLRGDLGTGSATPVLVGDAAWSAREGLAFSVRAGDQIAVFVRTPDGRILEASQERYANTFRAPRLAWEPGGGLLAIADDVGGGGSVLRVFDPSSGDLRAAALDPLGFSGLAWSPDGRAIAILTGSSALLMVDPNGEWISRVKTDWKGLLGWTS